jgi:hypothetical protein
MDVSDIDIPPTDLYNKLRFNPQSVKPATQQASPPLAPVAATKPDSSLDDRPVRKLSNSPALKRASNKPPSRPAPRPLVGSQDLTYLLF